MSAGWVDDLFDQMYRHQGARLEAFFRARLPQKAGSRALVQDLAQDVWLRYLNCLRSLPEPPEDPIALLYTMAQQRLTDQLRRQQTRPEVPNSTLTHAPEPVQTGNPWLWDTERIRKALEAGLKRLSPEQREAFEATELEGLSSAELAERQQAPLGTALSRKHLAMKNLQRFLQLIYDEMRYNL